MNRQQVFAHAFQCSSPRRRWKQGVLQEPDPGRKKGRVLPWRISQHGAVLLALDLFVQTPEGIDRQPDFLQLKRKNRAILKNLSDATVRAPEVPVDVRQRDECSEAQQLKAHWQQLVKGNDVTDVDVLRCALEYLGLNPSRFPAWLWERPRRQEKMECSKRMQRYRQLQKPAREFLKELTVGQMVVAAQSYLAKHRSTDCPTLAFFSAQKTKFLSATLSSAEQAHFDAFVLKTDEKVVLRHIRRALGGRWANYTCKRLLRGMALEVLLRAVVQHLDDREKQMRKAVAEATRAAVERYRKIKNWFNGVLKLERESDQDREQVQGTLEDRDRQMFASAIEESTEDAVLGFVERLVFSKFNQCCLYLRTPQERNAQNTLGKRIPEELKLPEAKRARASKTVEANVFLRIKDDEYLKLLTAGLMGGDMQIYKSRHSNQMKGLIAGGTIVFCNARGTGAARVEATVAAIAVVGEGRVRHDIPAASASSCLEELTGLTAEHGQWPKTLLERMSSGHSFDIVNFDELYDVKDKHMTLAEWLQATGCTELSVRGKGANVFTGMAEPRHAKQAIQSIVNWLAHEEKERDVELEKAEQDAQLLASLQESLEDAYSEAASVDASQHPIDWSQSEPPVDSPSDKEYEDEIWNGCDAVWLGF